MSTILIQQTQPIRFSLLQILLKGGIILWMNCIQE